MAADLTIEITITARGHQIEKWEGRPLSDDEWARIVPLAIGAVQQHDIERRQATAAAETAALEEDEEPPPPEEPAPAPAPAKRTAKKAAAK